MSENKPTLTAQEFFDQTLVKILEQGVAAVEDGGCCYRVIIGGKVCGCAIGVHLPPDAPQEICDYIGSFNALRRVHANIYRLINIDSTLNGLASELQHAHDATSQPHFKRDFIRNMRKVAEGYALVFNEALVVGHN